ncbi:uncharacterized protein LOC124184497 [Neodiprion fabricii]|uniref:uncharacterized protein LOC124184497 n=1 Tax=Neodiprion fabricii TaxID=2872261 RepID=UPI001ED92C7A|nr:uncharacterized protein LOC124184497 [Neodiprion fabricii]
MSHNNLLQSYTWDAPYDDPQQQFPRQVQDEVISVYEVYVKEETVGPDGRSDISMMPGEPGSSNQLMQGDCLDLDAAIGSEVINVDGSITKLLAKDTIKYKILEQNATEDNNVVMYSHPMNEVPSAPRLVDKDDPRSRLHFVKYLKRDGKTLKIWECGICSKEFRHQYTLMRHLPTHTDERNFKCEACGKAFRQLSTLSQHRAIHSDARPYVCEFCKKTFNRVSTLISHRKTHSEHKPHKCHLCGKGFHQKGNLRNHVFTHTNERPYKCEICGKGFNQMSNLMCHKVKAHAHAEKMPYVCGICGKQFPRRFSLRSHEEYKHGIKYRQQNAPAVLQDDGLHSGSLIVDKIDTKAMENAISEGQTPFALFKPAKGIPVLVKVGSAANCKQMLTPATAEDLRMAGKMTLSPTLAELDGIKAVQIKVPVVATVTQHIGPDGSSSFIVEPPGPGQEQESLIEPIESEFSCIDQREVQRSEGVDKNSQEDCNDLLELAAQGGIQFVRATEDGRYEVMTNSEARDLMAQNSHDVTILDGEEAEALSVVNMRGCSANNQGMEVEDTSGQITVLNAGGGSGRPLKSVPMEGIEILDEKDIDIVGGKSLHQLEPVRPTNGTIVTSTVFDQEKIYDYNKDFCSPINGLSVQPILALQDDALQTAMNKTVGRDLQTDSMNPLIQRSTSILSNSFTSFKQSNNSTSDHSIAAILSSNDHAIPKSQLMDVALKAPRFPDFENGNDLLLNTAAIIKPEVKILGPKNHGKTTALGQEKIVQFGKSGTNEAVKVLGHGDAYKDFNMLGSYSYDQYPGSQYTSVLAPDQRLQKKEVKILGRKNEPSLNHMTTTSGFEVSKCHGQESEIQENLPNPETRVDSNAESDNETYLSLLRINTWLRKSC